MKPRGTSIVVVISRVIACALLLAAGLVAFRVLEATRPQPPRNEKADELRRVVVVDVLERPAGRRWRGYGTAQPLLSADVPAQVGAVVTALAPNYREGAAVRTGEPLLELDAADFARQLDMASNTLAAIDAQLALLDVDEATATESVRLSEEEAALARADLARVEEAMRNDAAMAREVDRFRQARIVADRLLMLAREAAAKVPARRAALTAERERQVSARELAERDLGRCVVRSPIEGILQVADKEVGEMVQPGMRVARVVGTEGVEVPLLLPASARPHLAVGNVVSLRPDRDGAAPIAAHVARIAPEDDPLTRTVAVYAESDDANIAPGSFVEAEVASKESEVRTVLPRRAVSGGRVLEIVNGRVRAVPVEIEFGLTGLVPETGLPDTEWVVLKELLPRGTSVLLDASRQLPEGSAVVAVSSAEAARARRTPEPGAGETETVR